MCAMGLDAAMFLTGCATIPLELLNMLSSYKTASGMVTIDVWTGSTSLKDTVWKTGVQVDKDKFDNFAQGCLVIVAFTRSSSATYHKLQFNEAYPTGAAEMKNGVYEGGKYDSVHGGVDLSGKTLTYTVTDADAAA